MKKYHKVKNIRFEDHYLILTVDGKNYKTDVRTKSEKLAAAGGRARSHYIVSTSGYGIHWPEIDEDLSVDGLIGRKRSKPFRMDGIRKSKSAAK